VDTDRAEFGDPEPGLPRDRGKRVHTWDAPRSTRMPRSATDLASLGAAVESDGPRVPDKSRGSTLLGAGEDLPVTCRQHGI
jgi:hypothetical protein